MTKLKWSERASSYVAQRRCAEGKQIAVLSRHAARQRLRTMARDWLQRLKALRSVWITMTNLTTVADELATCQLITKPNALII